MTGNARFLVPVVCLAVLASCAPRVTAPLPGAPPPTPPPAEGKVRGVAVPSGIDVPLEGASVTVGGQQATVSQGGAFSLGEIEAGKQHVVVEKTFSSGKVRRILGISTIFVADNPVEIKVPVRDATDVDAYCLSCHPPAGKAVRRDQKVRDAHPSGVIAVKAVGDRALLDPAGRVTCESCHTAHRVGQYPLFGLGEIRKGPFCNRCHRSGNN